MRFLRSAVAILLAMALCAADDKDKPAKPDKELIQGAWEIVSAEDGGKPMDGFRDIQFVFTAELMTIKKKDAAKEDGLAVKYKLDATKKPKEFDTWHELDPGKPLIQLGVYSLDGDQFKLCLAAVGVPRPTRFETKPGEASNLFVLKRVK